LEFSVLIEPIHFARRLIGISAPAGTTRQQARLGNPSWRVKTSAFTLIEVITSIVIISIISAFTLINADSEDASARVDRAAQQVLAAFRYARMLSMGHGETSGSSYQPTDAYGVQINKSANTFTVYHTTWNSVTSAWELPGTTISDALHTGGTYVVNLDTDSTCAGVTISAVNLVGTSDTSGNGSSPYYCQYRPFGNTENPGISSTAILLSYGNASRSINIPAVGDAQEN
jgi:prepilin-type N-terminal cleavage/methylation domain-containing protein